jgi:DNA-binding transcriptional MerR regulator
MLIGELASKSGFSRDTIRYYEKLGLIQLAILDRQPNSYKNYPQHILDRLIQIRQFKELGFTLKEMVGLFDAFDIQHEPCMELPAQLDEKIALFDEKIKLLEESKNKLIALRKACDGGCDSTQGLPDCFSVT